MQEELPVRQATFGSATGWRSQWTPTHTAIVVERIAGATPEQLAKKYNYAPSTINNITSSTQGRALKREIHAHVLKTRIENYGERIAMLKTKILEHVEKFVDNEELEQKAPFAHFDRVLSAGRTLAQFDAPSALPSTVNNIQVNNPVNMNVSPELIASLTAALHQSEEVNKLHAAKSAELINAGGMEPAYG